MKEPTIKKETLDVVRQMVADGQVSQEVAEKYFPELAESEDEKVRKELIFYLRYQYSINENFEDIDKWIDWLEKQGEQKPILNVPTRDIILSIWDLGNEWKELTNGSISTEYGTQLDYIQKHWHESEYYLKEKQGEQKSIDKVEPKFHVGDWIIFNGLTLYINEVVEGYYRTISIDGIPNSYDWDIDDIARLWTIQDAKDGDVLATSNQVFIYRATNHNTIMVYTNMSLIDSVNVSDPIFTFEVKPATKEQCDFLFTKIKEAGYMWNKEKKELKMIEQEELSDFEKSLKHIMEETIECGDTHNLKADAEILLGMARKQMNHTLGEEDERIIKEIDEIIYECPYCESKEEISNWLKSLKQRIKE